MNKSDSYKRSTLCEVLLAFKLTFFCAYDEKNCFEN